MPKVLNFLAWARFRLRRSPLTLHRRRLVHPHRRSSPTSPIRREIESLILPWRSRPQNHKTPSRQSGNRSAIDRSVDKPLLDQMSLLVSEFRIMNRPGPGDCDRAAAIAPGESLRLSFPFKNTRNAFTCQLLLARSGFETASDRYPFSISWHLPPIGEQPEDVVQPDRD